MRDTFQKSMLMQWTAGLFLLISYLNSQTESFELGGYTKYLFSSSDMAVIGRVNDHLLHSRINSKWFITDGFNGGIEIRSRIFYGGSVEKIPLFLSSVRSQHELNDLTDTDIVWWNEQSSVGYSELDRFWLDATFQKLQVTIGRQRIAFGTALVWNPIDLFNPLSVLDFDYEERPGVDAVRLQYFSSEVSKIEIAIKPGSIRSKSVEAIKLLLNQWDYDFHFLSGMRGEDPFVGAAWAGDIEGAGFRGEFITGKISEESILIFPWLKNKWSSTVALSGDYTFTNTFYIHTELLFNDRGVTNSNALALPLMQSLHLLSPARWSCFQEVSYEIHPLVRAATFVIYNPHDGSSALVPSAVWSAFENIDLSFFGLFFSGNPGTEYGSYNTSAFARIKYSY